MRVRCPSFALLVRVALVVGQVCTMPSHTPHYPHQAPP